MGAWVWETLVQDAVETREIPETTFRRFITSHYLCKSFLMERALVRY